MKELQNPDSKEVILLLKETGLAATSIEQGLNALRKANFSNKKLYYQAFFLLSIGIERILKLIVIVNNLVTKDRFPENNELKNYGHDIIDLFKKVTKEIRPNEDFLNQDEIYLPILNFLSDFAKGSRYYNLDTLSGKNGRKDPLHEWNKIQIYIKGKHCKVKLSAFEIHIIESLEKKAIIHFHSESDTPIITGTEYFVESKVANQVQGFSVLYFYKIIDYLITILVKRSSEKRMLPEYQEFFRLFNNRSMTDADIKKKKDWSRL
nr:hypothetical protein [uncultured Draconibacterium sp.]